MVVLMAILVSVLMVVIGIPYIAFVPKPRCNVDFFSTSQPRVPVPFPLLAQSPPGLIISQINEY